VPILPKYKPSEEKELVLSGRDEVLQIVLTKKAIGGFSEADLFALASETPTA
jgi:hypothetical protein